METFSFIRGCQAIRGRTALDHPVCKQLAGWVWEEGLGCPELAFPMDREMPHGQDHVLTRTAQMYTVLVLYLKLYLISEPQGWT